MSGPEGTSAWDSLIDDVERLTQALREIADTPALTMSSEGRDRHAVLNGHKKCVAIARAALTPAAGACDPTGGQP